MHSDISYETHAIPNYCYQNILCNFTSNNVSNFMFHVGCLNCFLLFMFIAIFVSVIIIVAHKSLVYMKSDISIAILYLTVG